jgi:7,8-dihydroneopterin aldolase/epimerase/oxygenase
MDKVFISDLRIDTLIGVYDWERRVRQTVVLDLVMAHDIRRAAQTDNIEHALNYKAVAERIVGFVEASEFFLLEAMAEKLADLVMSEFSVPWLQLKVRKPGALRNASDVGVIIERGKLA